MSELQEIEVHIYPDGNIKIEVQGAKGKKCLELTKEMEVLLGAKIIDRNFTGEYDMTETVQTQQDILRSKI